MDGLSRAEYPGMLASLQPGLAVFVLQERAKRIGKINQEIADWLLERRKVEEQYVAGLRKLLLVKAPNSASELGVFQPAWESILNAIDAVANSHHLFSSRIEKDIEVPLRSFQNTKEMGNLTTISANLNLVAKELEDAQDKADKLSKKGGKTSSQKMDAATQRLESASQQWDSQAPFVFETLQALDEQRTNHLRDILTQLETHEVDQTSQNQATAEALLNVILEIKTEDEIQGFAQRVTAGRPKTERRAASRQSTIPGSSNSSSHPSHPSHSSHTSPSSHPPLPPVPQQHQQQYQQQLQQHHHQNSTRSDDTVSEHSGRNDVPTESKLRSRLGTMLGRRRQSVHSGFGPLSPGKGSSSFGARPSQSSHGRTISPRASSNNLTEMNHRLSSLAETPGSPEPPSTAESHVLSAREGATNGVNGNHGAHGSSGTNGFGSDVSGGATGASGGGARAAAATMHGMTADDIFGVPPPPGPPPSQQQKAAAAAAAAVAPSSPTKDAEGFTIPARPNDPISQAQRDATAVALGEDGELAFKLNIQEEPVADEDADAKKAAMSNVANTLTMAMPSRKGGTVRGRRDVRNTIYVPSMPVPDLPTSSSPSLRPTSPTISPPGSRPAAVAALASENSIGNASDTQSIRSATSLGGLAHLKHPDMSGPGLSTSVIETVSASFEDGELKLAKIAGEIAFAYNPSSASVKETIRVNNMELLEAIGPNRIFVRNTTAADTFELNTTHLQAHKPAVGFTFRALGESATSLGKHCPLVVKPVWKPTGDKLGLLLQYRLNAEAAATMSGPVTLHNLVLIATYEGARASGAQTKPTGTHIKDKHLVYWRVGDVTLTDTWAKIVCRILGQQGGEPQPGHIEARWEYAMPAVTESSSSNGSGIGISISQLESTGHGKGKDRADEADDDEADPFADDIAVVSSKPADSGSDAGDSWVEVPTVRQIVSGRYEAK
ncbi:hypothetical protein CMQ_3794 [Grosmannia clavigera kw1407]|uniref:MHD domain-containing protein n=1 Tax=Grosmannia clavigera (strain kw1407 / UAMH 11150) TaxID=655863 RepID=F0X829_GROCL|nr:uncharacterized protein CMQ_3794 [Grosmannia clavigera kw1407]EFX05725.1 hypothetical protein CMQ_3794 [Grosmannia clavigera kw1407]